MTRCLADPHATGRPHTRVRNNRIAVLGLTVVALVYLAAACALTRLHAFWSPDMGPRFAMARSWCDGGSLVYVSYAHAHLDPEATCSGLGSYLVRVPKGLCTLYPPLSPMASAVAYRLGGFGGLVAIPLISGWLTLVVAWRAARRLGAGLADAVPLVLGLATPLFIYSVTIWDYSLQMLVAACAAYCMARSFQSRSPAWPAVAGAALGAGLWLHEAFAALFIAALLAALSPGVRRERPRHALWLLLGLAPLLAGWLALNAFLYGSALGPHLMGPNQVAGASRLTAALAPGAIAHRVLVDVVAGERGYGRRALYSGLLAAALLLPVLGGRTRAALPWLWAAISIVAAYLIRGQRWAHGLFVATPLLVIPFCALGPPGKCEPDPSPDGFRTWSHTTIWVFACLVALNPITLGTEWGNRFMLVALPLMALVALRTADRLLRGADTRARLALAAGALALVAVGVYSQTKAFRSVRTELTVNRARALAVRAAHPSVVVTDAWWLGPHLAADPGLPPIVLFPLYAEDCARAARIADPLAPRRAFYLGTTPGLERTAAALRALPHPFTLTKVWRIREAYATAAWFQR